MVGEHIRLTGRVQGVGFRATVEQLALAQGVRGWVRNDGRDVLIAIVGPASEHDGFLAQLMQRLPPGARVDHAERTVTEMVSTEGFSVAATR